VDALMPNMIGLDLGTTTVTGVLIDSWYGEILGQVQRTNDSALWCPFSTRAEQDPQRLFALALDVLAELSRGGEPVDGIALTGQKHGLLCVGSHGEALTSLISWQDRRTAEPWPDGSTTLERLHARLGGLGWRDNGCRIQHGYGAASLFWLVREGELPAGTDRVCTIAGWLAGRLVGQSPVTDPTFAASWGVYDLVRGAWNDEFLDCLDLAERLFPPVQPSGVRLGGLMPEVARQVELAPGLPVYNPLGDTQGSFLGSVSDREHSLFLNLGTGGQVCWLVSRLEAPTEAVETRPLPDGDFLRVGASLCGGAAYAWLNRTVRAWLAEFGFVVDEEEVYTRLNALAEACDDVGVLRVRTTFLGARGEPDEQAGAILGIPLESLRLDALARTTLMGIVDELCDLYFSHVRDGAQHTQIVAAGGAVRRNPLLSALIEERFGLPVQLSRHREAAALGTAMLSARAPTFSARRSG
jgi:sedoheptulokinase